MKKRTILIGLCFTSFVINAQTVTPTVYSNQGGYNVAAGGSISWTVGEPISETYSTSTNKTTMGFHQPELGVATLINEQDHEQEILVYPNPVSEILNVNFQDLENEIYKLELVDELGRSIFHNETIIKENSKMIQLNMTSYAEGIYYLRISNSLFNRTVKLNKTH